MKISYIIRFTNGETRIKECVDSLLAQEGMFTNELIFVNDNTTDNTIDYVKKLLKNPPKNTEIKLVNLPKNSFTYASATNAGIESISGDFVSIITVHTQIQNNNAISKLISNFDDSKVLAVYPRIMAAPDTALIAKLTKKISNVSYKIIKSKEYFSNDDSKNIANYAFQTSFCLIRSEIFKDKKNWFHELPRSEDLEWSYRMINDGWRIILDPSVVLFHYDYDTSIQIARRWLNATVAISLIINKSLPNQFKLLISVLKSYVPFYLKVFFIENKFFLKIKYLIDMFIGTAFIVKECMFFYKNYTIWEQKYTSSIRS